MYGTVYVPAALTLSANSVALALSCAGSVGPPLMGVASSSVGSEQHRLSVMLALSSVQLRPVIEESPR